MSGDDLTAYVCTNGHATFPGHQRCPECGAVQSTTLDLSETRASVVTWTTSMATPPGVREPNHLAIVEFDLDAALDGSSGFTPGTVEGPVRTLAQLTSEDVESGDVVEPTYVEELREPGAGIREPDSQSWDGYRFQPVDD
ncbi:nucleic acid-binding protein [Halorubellus sp. JP-L1]|uniref:nucleic acid-binding protein n=1 Tax=Halorubellus sp. JP-L1 TaxID=2715753 RepID=UPI00140A86CB|nr:nucleic acid-binding protein [Halorubellus sp. JP-L1]NHN40202.1 nucleic acid-binding protein [Halorubellus sp. JP-L1]